ncbi:hypothetical protein CUJ91_18270 [Paraburkholderia graminis]|nr:hypothetical protein CUJ91_18270 [Paraburkholderia graminis]
MHIYFSYSSVPELASVPRGERKEVIRKAARALAGTAEGRSQFRLFLGWLVFAGVSTVLFNRLAEPRISSSNLTIITSVTLYLSYTFVFQFQVRRLRPHIRAVLSAQSNREPK